MALLGESGLKAPGHADSLRSEQERGRGSLVFRTRFGTEHNGENLLAERAYSKDSRLRDGYPEFSFGMRRRLGWHKDLTQKELETIIGVAGVAMDEFNPEKMVAREPVPAAIENVNWKTYLSGGIQRVAIQHGCAPCGRVRPDTRRCRPRPTAS